MNVEQLLRTCCDFVALTTDPQDDMNRTVEPSNRPLFSTNDLSQKLPISPPFWLMEQLLNLSGLAALDRAYRRIQEVGTADNPFRGALNCLRIRTLVSDESIQRIPESGSTLLIANHPFGGADGLALGALALERRRDVRVLVNSWLSELEFLSPWLLAVDVFNAQKNVIHNVCQLRSALRHLQSGGLLIVFPAGTVSQFNPKMGKTEDPAWSSSVAALARLSQSSVVPCHFSGNNRPLFHLAGLIHSSFRTALLPSELVSKQDTAISVSVGTPIRPDSLDRFKNDAERVTWFRLRTYGLESITLTSFDVRRKLSTLSTAVDGSVVAVELSGLPPSALLISQGPYRIYFFKQRQAANTLREIGRLRELSFRAVDEGTGQPSDIDRFDSDYYHLVLWDTTSQCIVGAYRLAFCDEIIKRRGLSGLYSSSLFRYKSPLIDVLNGCIELGRSFVRPEYQKKPLPLALLWRGIGEVLCRNPKYRRLLGPVSISNRYIGASQRLLITYLRELQRESDLQAFVIARNPIQVRKNEYERQLCCTKSVTPRQFSSLLSELDSESKRLPVLLERYLELGANVLGVNRDPNFGNCIDALVVVELEKTPDAMLKRFMGQEGAARFINTWKLAS